MIDLVGQSLTALDAMDILLPAIVTICMLYYLNKNGGKDGS